MLDSALPRPARPDLVQWGDVELTLRFAGLSFTLRGLSAKQAEAIRRRFPGADAAAGASEASQLAVTTRVGCFPIDELPPRQLSRNGLYTPLISHRPDGVGIRGYRFGAAIAWDDAEFRGWLWGGDEDAVGSSIVFENYLRILASYAALARGGLLLHSAGIVIEGKAYLFTGRSGAGKTTLCRKAHEAGIEVLSDDINVVLPGGSETCFQAHAVPFAGELGALVKDYRSSYPLAGFLHLNKGDRPGARQLGQATQLAKILGCCSGVNGDPYRLDDLLHNAQALMNAVPLRELQTRRDDAFGLIRALIHGD